MPLARRAARRRQRRAAFLVVFGTVLAAVLASGAAAVISGSVASNHRRLTIYSVATGIQYINTADDRARGKINNPLDSNANKLAPKSAGRNGPFAGDVAVYALRLYSDSAAKHGIGTAVYTCFFNYDRHALCQAYYKFKAGGTIVGSGPVDFKKSSFTIVVSGGTTTYLGVQGQASASPSRGNAQRIDFEFTKAASAASQSSQKLTVYAVPATVQFMNHADDRLRGMSTNPFKLKQEAVILGKNGNEKGNGPFPGDDILYGFKLFANPNKTTPMGAAMFTCYYLFVKRATCDSYFDLGQGLLLASGQVKFGGIRFTLGVIGGTRAYLGTLGQVSSRPAAENIQRFDLSVTGLRK